SSTVTDESGLYSFNGDVNGMFKVRALAEMKQSGTQSYHFQVKNIATGKPGSTFALQSSQAYISGSCTSGNCTLNLTALHSNRSNGPFAILDGVKYALDSVLALDSSIQLPELHLRWSSSNSSGSYFTRSTTTCGSVANCIAIKGASSDSDEFDWHVITHEFTHYLEANLARSDSIGGPHTENDLLDPRVAYGEGLANAIGAIFLDDPVYIDTANGGGFSFDMENGTHTLKGYYSESSVQSIIWDLYDSNNEGLDNLTLGLMPIWSAMRSLKTTDEITYLHPFVSALKVGRPGDTGSINAILSMENVATDANGESDVSADVDSAYTALGVTGHNCAGSTMEYAYNPILENVSGSGSSVYSGTHKGSQLCGAVAPGLNKLFGSQFIRVTPDYSGVMQITVTDTDTNDFDDPDVFVYQAGDLKGSAATDGGETLNVIVDAGKVYIVEIRTFDNCMAYILQTGSSYYCTSKAGEAEYTATIDLP
ncbi:MAG: hypothetical protein KDK27_17665, partial [Leptospiraceae bacterium]|nr:hypothetical protein [Leptospiraceae bacterium]